MTVKLPRITAFDLETRLIEPGILAPPIVCGSSAGDGPSMLHTAAQALAQWRYLIDSDVLLTTANGAYDAACAMEADPRLIIPTFEKYDRGEVYDVLIAQALDAIANGCLFKDPLTGGDLYGTRPDGKKYVMKRYSLELVTKLVLGREDAKKNDRWRLRYAMLERFPFTLWPPDSKEYPINDVENTLEVTEKQLLGHANLQCMPDEARAALALHLSACHGLRTDPEMLDLIEREGRARQELGAVRFHDLGFTDADGSKEGKVVKKRLAEVHGATGKCPSCAGTGKAKSKITGKLVTCVPRYTGLEVSCDGTGLDLSTAPNLSVTPKGGIQAGRDFLSESGDDDLMDFAEHQEDDKTFSTYLPWLRGGVKQPLNLQPNSLITTARTSYNGVIQQMPRKGKLRSSVIPRKGNVFCSVDYASGELCSLAQTPLWTVGYSTMADVINETKDPGALHNAFGAKLMGISVSEMLARLKAGDKQAKDNRQGAKVGNFGFGADMGAATYIGIRFCILLGGAERCGVNIVREWKGRPYSPVCRACCETAEQVKSEWLTMWPEMKAYFKWVKNAVNHSGEIVSFGNGMMRGNCSFTDGANHRFQNLLAQVAKRGLWLATREMYARPESVLYGSRVTAFLHDELLAEMPEDVASLAGPRLAHLMVEAKDGLIPDVFMVAEPALMRRWEKNAATVYDANGVLQVWEAA